MTRSKMKLTRGGRALSLPLLSAISFQKTSRLLLSAFSPADPAETPLSRLADDTEALKEITDTERKTDDLVIAENILLPPGLQRHELVSHIPYASVINAAFVYTSTGGSRFNAPFRGAWYAGKSVTTAQAEVIFHATARQSAMGEFTDDLSYDEYLADLAGEYHDLRISRGFDYALDSSSYIQSQLLAQVLLEKGSLGIVYPSVRHAGGICISCFRPALVANVRKGRRFRFHWAGSPEPTVETVSR